MWISREHYQAHRDERIKAEAIVAAVQSHNVALQTSLDWMRVRLTQLEHERAQLIFNYMGVKVQVPSIEPATNPAEASADALNQTLTFADMGDEEAARLGIEWNADGTVRYR